MFFCSDVTQNAKRNRDKQTKKRKVNPKKTIRCSELAEPAQHIDRDIYFTYCRRWAWVPTGKKEREKFSFFFLLDPFSN